MGPYIYIRDSITAMFNPFRKKKPKKTPTKPRQKPQNKDLIEIKQLIEQLSTKSDVDRVRKDVISSRKAIIKEVSSIPESQQLSSLLTEHITSPLKDYIAQALSSNQAVKQLGVKQLSSNQAGLDKIVVEMKQKVDMLTPRHMRVLSVLAQKREEWLGYDSIGSLCSPQLSGSCIRGYIADLINVYSIPIEKKTFGKQGRVRVSEKTFKQLAITKLID